MDVCAWLVFSLICLVNAVLEIVTKKTMLVPGRLS